MRLARSWETLLILAESSQPRTASELHRLIHERHLFSDQPCGLATVRDDLKTLRRVGFPLVALDQDGREVDLDVEADGRGRFKNLRWALREPASLRRADGSLDARPTAADIVALNLARDMLTHLHLPGYRLRTTTQRLLDEMVFLLNRALRESDRSVEELALYLHRVDPRSFRDPVSAKVYEAFCRAIRKGRVVVATYENRDGKCHEVDIVPAALYFSGSRPYALAAGAQDGKLRAWRLDRFREPRLTRRQAPAIDAQEVEERLRATFKGWQSNVEKVVLSVRPEAAYLFREFEYHPSQKVRTSRKDGSLEVRLEVACGWGFEEFLLGFGELVTVKKPEGLRERLAERLRTALAAYE